MQKLIVRNFGPIRELDLDIKDLSLFIGEQATGKSTVAKLVYFFKKVVKDELMGYLVKPLKIDLDWEEAYLKLYSEFQTNINWQFKDLFFGENDNNFDSVDYQYKSNFWLRILGGDKNWVVLYLTDAYYEIAHPMAQMHVYNKFYDILQQIIAYRKKYTSKEWALSSPSRSAENEKKEKAIEIENLINELFGDDAEAIYIPAGRSLLAALSERLPNKGWDMLMEKFRDKITDLKPAFGQSLSEIIEQKKQRGNGIPDKDVLELSIQKIKEILKGEYRVDEEGEKIYFNEEDFVKISLASSGQQEALWILLQLFILILNREKAFLIIEEPEAHLFPKAQKSLVELITLLFNEGNSQIIITTHSPYILTSFNNLIYAGNVGQQHEEVNEIIPKSLWLDVKKVGAYRLTNGITEDLMDEESKMIRAEEIDTVSQRINEDFDALLNLELQ